MICHLQAVKAEVNDGVQFESGSLKTRRPKVLVLT